ncbi:MAG: RNA methyltransferase [Firmicutes bacterium]|nr:RNA methyltransferase [Bacillota bacterium]
MIITSLENPRIKKYIRLKDKKYRDEFNEFIVEGEHLVKEAYKAGLVKEIILEIDDFCSYDCPKVLVTKEIIKKISTLDCPVSILALCQKKKMDSSYCNRLLLLDKIQDPGNLGTIIRSSKAFDVDTIVLGDNSVDLYNPKVVRSTQGMLFHMNIISKNLEEFIPLLKKENILIYGTSVDGGKVVSSLTKEEKEKYALVMGNEGNGVSKEVLDLCDKYLYIPMNEEVESLNVAIATSILLYELNCK